MRGGRGVDRSDPCEEHETVPGWMRILWAHATGLLAALWGIITGCGMGCGQGARTGVWHGPHNGPMGTEIHGTRGLVRCRYGAKGNGTWDGKGGRKRQATAMWDWETSRHGVVNHGPAMGSLATGSPENALNSGTAVRCLQG